MGALSKELPLSGAPSGATPIQCPPHCQGVELLPDGDDEEEKGENEKHDHVDPTLSQQVFGHDTPPSSPNEEGKEHSNFLDDGTLLKDCGEPDSAATGNDQEAHAAVDRELREVLLSCQWGVFAFTPKQPGEKTGKHGGYSVRCPFH